VWPGQWDGKFQQGCRTGPGPWRASEPAALGLPLGMASQYNRCVEAAIRLRGAGGSCDAPKANAPAGAPHRLKGPTIAFSGALERLRDIAAQHRPDAPQRVGHAKWQKLSSGCATVRDSATALDIAHIPTRAKRLSGLQRAYERYLAMARAEAQNGNTVAAENYYQHAEHYFRSMRSK
jgi:hypothetical protein